MISAPEREGVTRGRLPAARRDRRPALAALALLLILLGALGSALLVFRSGDREDVLAARSEIQFGQTMAREDFSEVRAASDTPGLIKASDLNTFLGTVSLTYLPEGALLNPKMFSAEQPIPPGGEAVGVVLDATQRPSEVPRPGEVVRVYYISGSGGDATTGAQSTPIVNAARVLSVGSGAGAGTRSLTLLVRADVASKVADFASSGNIAVTVLPGDTKPGIDVAAAADSE